MATPSAVLLLLVPLFLWRMYSRVRRLIGRQRLSKVRPWITLAIFPLITLLLAWATWAEPLRLGWLAAGFAVGVPLGLFGLRRTRFEPTVQGLFYTPNVHLGIVLSLLFAGRILYRLVEIYAFRTALPTDFSGFAVSTLTLCVFGLLAGYYMTYAVGLVRWRRTVTGSGSTTQQ
ncbi:MAG: hypothetical protein ACM30H_13395 [Clostridia bacterium]